MSTTVSLDLIKRTIGDLYLENCAIKERLLFLEQQQRAVHLVPPAGAAEDDDAAGEASG